MREWSVASVLRWREWPHEMQKLKFMMREWPVCLERGFPEKGWKVTSSTILHPLLLWFWAITTQRDWQSSLLHNRCKLKRWLVNMLWCFYSSSPQSNFLHNRCEGELWTCSDAFTTHSTSHRRRNFTESQRWFKSHFNNCCVSTMDWPESASVKHHR